MRNAIEQAVQEIRDVNIVVGEARKRLEAAWAEIDAMKAAAALRRERRKNMQRSAAENARTSKFCRKARLLEIAGIIDEDDDVLLGIFLAAKEGLKDPARRNSWQRRGQVKALKRGKTRASLIIQFREPPHRHILEKLDEDGFSYDSRRTRWLGDGDLNYGHKLIELSGVGGKALAGQAPNPEDSR